MYPCKPISQMDPANIGIVFAPNIFRAKEGSDPSTALHVLQLGIKCFTQVSFVSFLPSLYPFSLLSPLCSLLSPLCARSLLSISISSRSLCSLLFFLCCLFSAVCCLLFALCSLLLAMCSSLFALRSLLSPLFFLLCLPSLKPTLILLFRFSVSI